jgi:hypothetical protein
MTSHLWPVVSAGNKGLNETYVWVGWEADTMLGCDQEYENRMMSEVKTLLSLERIRHANLSIYGRKEG